MAFESATYSKEGSPIEAQLSKPRFDYLFEERLAGRRTFTPLHSHRVDLHTTSIAKRPLLSVCDKDATSSSHLFSIFTTAESRFNCTTKYASLLRPDQAGSCDMPPRCSLQQPIEAVQCSKHPGNHSQLL